MQREITGEVTNSEMKSAKLLVSICLTLLEKLLKIYFINLYKEYLY
jgi:hypothetical protein